MGFSRFPVQGFCSFFDCKLAQTEYAKRKYLNRNIARNVNALTIKQLGDALIGSAAAFRCRRKLQPAAGEGGKVFPPTFAGAVYAVEQRRIPGRPDPVTCVVLDTVQSQANRMELALQEALDADRIKIPVVKVNFSEWSPTGDVDADKQSGRLIDAVGAITSLQVPHRLADAILRDSQTKEGTEFRKSDKGKTLNTVSQQNATALYQLCPTALVFGMWDSTGPKGGLGAKFERAVVSEVIGVGASFGVRTASRIDPLITKTRDIVLYEDGHGGWTLNENEARKDEKGKPVLLGKKGKVSQANLGNVTPAFARYTKGAEGLDPLKTQPLSVDYRIAIGKEQLEIRNRGSAGEQQQAREGQIAAGGVTVEYAEQLTTLSLIVLRRLRLPVRRRDAESDEEFKHRAKRAEDAGRTVLAALGLCAATLAFEAGMGLRSRCLLWPDQPMTWELLAKPGEPAQTFSLTGDDAVRLLNESVEAAKEAGLPWEETPIELVPQKKLVDLVRLSQLEATKEETEQTP